MRITDLGIARVWNPENAKDTSGTPGYMAPEVISDKEITSETDFWSLGVLIYDLFTAKTPFFADNVGKIFENILNLNIDWSHFNNIETPDEDAKDLIKKFLVLNPKERWGDKNFEQINEIVLLLAN